MLFTMVHGDDFSMQTWRTFLDSRGENKNEDVYFDEIKVSISYIIMVVNIRVLEFMKWSVKYFYVL